AAYNFDADDRPLQRGADDALLGDLSARRRRGVRGGRSSGTAREHSAHVPAIHLRRRATDPLLAPAPRRSGRVLDPSVPLERREERVAVLLDEVGGVAGVEEVAMGEDALQEREVGLDAFDAELTEGAVRPRSSRAEVRGVVRDHLPK